MARHVHCEQLNPMRLLQLSDPHLLADPDGVYRQVQPLARLRLALEQADRQPHDLLLLTGDLCQDESWGGYRRLRELLEGRAALRPVALLPGNHDHPALLRMVLARSAVVAPAVIDRPGCRLVLLDSHRASQLGGWLGERQLAWLAGQLASAPDRATLVALHHPPLAIGDPGLDAIALQDGPQLLQCLTAVPGLKAVLFGHIHQHWQGWLPGRAAGLEPVALLGCPSTLSSFPAVQACPLGRPQDPGGRWLQLEESGAWRQRLLRW